jgi:NAD(P)-dependent dehydrogenase (short-subunit alcohol dehydrogenase family)
VAASFTIGGPTTQETPMFAKFEGKSAYTASKHAVLGLTRSATIEYGTRGVRLNAVSPGPILTPLTRGEKEQTDAVAAMTAMKRMGQPTEIAKVVAFLLSSDASFITGAEIVADGGVMLS